MKLALISDLHGTNTCLAKIETIIVTHRPDAIVISGDITNLDQIDYLDRIFKILRKFSKMAYMIWGNSDFDDARAKISGSKYNINLTCKNFEGVKIAGMGENDEPQLIAPDVIRNSIFVTHKPPLKSNINRALKNAPQFHISGHLHNIESVTKYPSTTLIQVPTLQNSRFALFDPATAQVEFLTV